MRPSVIGDEGIQPYKFSSCSAEQFQQWMGEGHALCLLNKPNQIADFGSCGNGVVDEGEDCDCGSPVSWFEGVDGGYARGLLNM